MIFKTPSKDYGPLTAIVHHPKRTLHLDWITAHWDRLGQFCASFAAGHTTASVALKRLLGCGPRNHFYRAMRELGRLYKTIFILDYLSDPALRWRVRRGLLVWSNNINTAILHRLQALHGPRLALYSPMA